MRRGSLDVVSFGRQLFETADLDPIYVALQRLKLSGEQLAAWLVAYWLFYSAAFASYASEWEGHSFWQLLEKAATNEDPSPAGGRWPRGSERRHFRGKASVQAVARLRAQYATPLEMLDFILDGPADIKSVMGRVQEHYLFGSWIAFKVADLLDAVWGVEIDQADVTVFLYDTPRKSILEKAAEGVLPLKSKEEKDLLVEAMHWLQGELADCRIPHKPKHKPDWFSLETVWCKHASHLHGHYPLQKDILEIRHGLEGWTRWSPTAEAFLAAMPVAKPAPQGLLGGRS